ncbi:MAG TPA: 8-oxoguanine DNA glycosylase, partial [Clostridiales bacterium]|nr:8-oxoguanine DNA glycosylase [Clostridiales bacterium]
MLSTYKFEHGNDFVRICNIPNFDLSSTFENGQCFRWEKISPDHYIGVAMGKVLEVFKDGDDLVFYNTNIKEFESLWIPYLTLDVDYEQIKQVLSKDPMLKKAVEFAPGLHLLRQNFHETLICFILSSNNNIQRIKKIVNNLCQATGKDISYNGKTYKSFPPITDMQKLTCEDFMSMGAGYRSKYLVHTINALCCKDIDVEHLKNCSLD